MRLLYWQAVTILNPHLSQGTKDFHGASVVLEPLAWIGTDGGLIPALAAEVPTIENGGIAADYTSITWKLKEGVKWSDGTDFTSDDVVFTYEYISDDATGATTAQTVVGVESVEAVDPLTVRVNFEGPNANPYQIFVSQLGLIIQRAQFGDFMGAKAGDAPGNQGPIGTGPYKVADFRPGDVVVYEINENYRDPNKPFFKEVELKGGGDAPSASRAVCQTGEFDYGWNIQVEWSALQPIVEGSGTQCDIVVAVSPNVERILLNQTNPSSSLSEEQRSEPGNPHPFLSDLKVREALAMAIDREALDGLYGEAGEPTCNILPKLAWVGQEPFTGGADSMPICANDIAAANAQLDAAGWTRGGDGIRQKDGVRMSITYSTSINSLRQKEQAIVKENWEALGLEVELIAVDASVFFGVEGPDTIGRFYWDTMMYTNGAESADPTNYLSGWECDQIRTRADNWSGNNQERYCSEEYDALLDQLRTELDAEKRADLIVQLNDHLAENVVNIPLVARTSPTSVAAKDINGYEPNPFDSELLNIGDWTRD
ncbi:MAG: peptide ABC transporter substrate-binding protein [Candidatus Limnocylindria bacterium]